MSDNAKLFGMSANAGRWVFVVLGMIINLCLGAVYAYSVFKGPLEKLFSATAKQGNMPFMVFIAIFALFTFLAGRFIDKLGPRIVMIVGGVVVGLGWMLAKFSGSITMVSITYGIIGGAGVGLVYGGPVSVCTKWFPDRKGLAVGLALLGLAAPPLSRHRWRSPSSRLRDRSTPFFTWCRVSCCHRHSLDVHEVPAAGWKPAGWNPPQTRVERQKASPQAACSRTSSFYGLWICYLFGTTRGLMAIGVSATVGGEVIGLDVGTAAFLVSIFAIFNGIGRPIFGSLADKITPRYAAIVTFVIIGVASLMMLGAGKGSGGRFCRRLLRFWLTLGGCSPSVRQARHPSSVSTGMLRNMASSSAPTALAPSSAALLRYGQGHLRKLHGRLLAHPDTRHRGYLRRILPSQAAKAR
jgi:MFS family permease